jgi:RNA polymerase sigma-70 factor, ECF subfamily
MAEPSQETDVLIVQARKDRETLGELLDRYRPFLILLAQDKIGPRLAVRCDGPDVVQQTLTEAASAFANFKGTSEPEFLAWLRRIHYHNLAEAVRKHVLADKQTIDREQRLDASGTTATFCWREPVEDQSTPSQHMIKGERALRLAAILQSLPEMQREAVRLRHVEGLPVEEVARSLNRSLAATAGLIKRGLQALRANMSKDSWC